MVDAENTFGSFGAKKNVSGAAPAQQQPKAASTDQIMAMCGAGGGGTRGGGMGMGQGQSQQFF